MSKLQVLLVEDDEGNIDAWKDKAATHNADAAAKGFRVESVYAKSVAEASSVLDSSKIDAMVVDLRLLPAEGAPVGPNDDGNTLIDAVVGKHPVAIAIYTGQAQEASASHPQQVEVFDRGGGLAPVFEWLEKQCAMVTQLQRTRVAIERQTARIFFKSIWPRWTHWTEGAAHDLGDMLARHVVAHVHDSMLHLGGGVAHPEESYFVPPLKDQLDTGDLIRDDKGEFWIVVTPRCDLATDPKPATTLTAHCRDISTDWKGKPGQRSEMMQHKKSFKLHFLPAMRDDKGQEIGPWYVEFGNLSAVAQDDVANTLSGARRFASLAPQFVPSLVERFGAYFSRIGTPNISRE